MNSEVMKSFSNNMEKTSASADVRTVKRILRLGLHEMAKREFANKTIGGKVLNLLKEYRSPLISGAIGGTFATVPSLILQKKNRQRPYVLFQLTRPNN